MGIWHHDDVVNVQRVAPDGVLTGVRSTTGLVYLMRESYHLCLLREFEVAVAVFQGIDAVFTRGNTLDDEVTCAVGTGNALQGLGTECRVSEVGIESYADALDGFQVRGIYHVAAHLEGVYLLSGRERKGIVSHRVAFVVVADGIAEVYGIGGVGNQRVLQLHDNLLALGGNLRCFYLWRRHDDILRGVSQFDVFVEEDADLLFLDSRSLVCRHTAQDAWRVVVKPAAIGGTHASAARNEKWEMRNEECCAQHSHRTLQGHFTPPYSGSPFLISSPSKIRGGWGALTFLTSHFSFPPPLRLEGVRGR